MYASLLYLILVLLMTSFGTENNQLLIMLRSSTALYIGVCLYIFILACIWMQNRFFYSFRRHHKGFFLLIANSELLLFFAIYQFVLGIPKLFTSIPFFGTFQSLQITLSLFLYLVGLGIFHISSHSYNRYQNAANEIRFLIPFAIPFILITFVTDLFIFYPDQIGLSHFFDSAIGSLFLFFTFALLIISLMIFMPYWMQKIWKCRPLTESPLRERLLELCDRAHFKHAGLQTWTVLQKALTAGIIGIIPRFRYILFTDRLLQEFSPHHVEAILAHEIGHSYRRHLWIYPFILLGMPISLEIVTKFFSPIGSPAIDFIIYAIGIVIYFRLVFGFFSRLFERQADLHVFMLKVDPKYLIEALSAIGTKSGSPLDEPNWHHFSIQERISFLEKVQEHPNLIGEYNQYVKWCVVIYGACFLLGVAFLIFSNL